MGKFNKPDRSGAGAVMQLQADQASEDTKLIIEQVDSTGFHIKSVSTGMYLTFRTTRENHNNNPITYDPLNPNYHQLWRYDESSYGWGNVEANLWMAISSWHKNFFGFGNNSKLWNQQF